nr:G-type lectin S-receptor-like serine/threonine-protein kinase LECRK3 [Tanacetum cinerariifolium]
IVIPAGKSSFLLVSYSCCLAAQRTNGSGSVGASLTATTDATPWLSPSGHLSL